MSNIVDFPTSHQPPAEVNMTKLVAAMIDLNRDMTDLKYSQKRNRFHINLLIKALKAKGMLNADLGT